MFTGIVQGTAKIAKIADREGLRTFTLDFPPGFCTDLAVGASVSTDGVCLTVTELTGPDQATFDVMLQSLAITTLGAYQEGDRANVERAAKDGAEIGGHPLSGHVDFTSEVVMVKSSDTNRLMRFSIPEDFRKYVFAKGYIAINGASLTVSEVNRAEGWFEVWLIRDAPDDGVRGQAGRRRRQHRDRARHPGGGGHRARDGAGKPGQAPAAAGSDPQEKGLSLEDFVTPQQVKLK